MHVRRKIISLVDVLNFVNSNWQYEYYTCFSSSKIKVKIPAL